MKSTLTIAFLLFASPVLAQQFTYVREHTPSFSGSSLYGSVTVFGDLTGDGIAEYGVADIDTSPQVDIFDGSDGSLYLSIAGSAEHFGLAGCSHPDVDGDGIPEIAIGESEFDVPSLNAGRVMVYSGADGSFIRQIFGPASVAADQGFGQDMAPFVDINGDGLAEFLVSARKGGTGGHYSGSVSCIDGSSGTILYTVNGLGEYDYQARVGSHGPDIDGDGIPEFGIGAEENWANSGDGYLRIVSGADGTVLLTIDGWGTQLDRFGNSHVWTDDFDGDGLADIAISAPGQDFYGAEMGRVGVFSSVSGLLLQEIIPPQGVLNGFGDTMNSQLLALPDSDGDGIGEILIPASEYDDGSTVCSAVFVCSPILGTTLLDLKDPSGTISSFGRSLEHLESQPYGSARLLIGGYDIGKALVYDFLGLDEDADDDGLADSDEIMIYGTNPVLFDSDGDGLGDGQELGVTFATAPSDTNPAVFLEDSDPLTTTDPLVHDTDGGGTSDGNEDVDKNGAVDIDEDDPNDPLDDLFQLSVLGLSPGQQATISVWECRPGAVAVPLFSMAGQASSLYPGYNQLELALSSPINQLTGMTIGPGGSAFSTIWVPPYVSIGVSVYWQAVEITGGGDAYRPSTPIIAVVQ